MRNSDAINLSAKAHLHTGAPRVPTRIVAVLRELLQLRARQRLHRTFGRLRVGRFRENLRGTLLGQGTGRRNPVLETSCWNPLLRPDISEQRQRLVGAKSPKNKLGIPV
jgi:hypothetical protein